MLKNKNIRQFDFSGSKIGNWSVISISYTNDRGATYWKCVCVCGNEKDVLCYRLFHGKTKSCGCGALYATGSYPPRLGSLTSAASSKRRPPNE